MKTCKEISHILSRDEEISFVSRMELKMHLLMCKGCSSYATHLKMMKDGFQKLFAHLTKVDSDKIKKLEDEIISKVVNKK